MKIRLFSSVLLAAALLVSTSFSIAANKGQRPQPSPEAKQCFEGCKKEKDARAYESCMNDCATNHPNKERPSTSRAKDR